MAHYLVASYGRSLVVPTPVLAEADYLLRSRVGLHAARAFLAAIADGEHEVAFLSPGLLRRAVEIDQRYPELDLGIADTSVMAVAERHDLPILTFDFKDFRAATPTGGDWPLVVDEAQLASAMERE